MTIHVQRSPFPRVPSPEEIDELRRLQPAATGDAQNSLAAMKDEAVTQVRLTRAPGAGEPIAKGEHGKLTTMSGSATAGPVSATTDRQSLTVSGSLPPEGTTLGFTVAPGVGVLSGGTTVDTAAGPTAIGGVIVGNKNLLGIGGMAAVTQSAGTSVMVGATVLCGADSRLKILDIRPDQMRVEWTTKRSPMLQLAVGYGGAHAGVSGRLGLTYTGASTYKTWMCPDEATRLFRRQGHGLKKNIVRFADGLFPSRFPPPVPDRKTPGELRVGDELTVMTSGTVSGGIAGSAGGFLVGVYGAMSGEFELTLNRVSDSAMDVVIAPRKRAKAVAIAADFPLLAEGHHVSGNASACRLGYRIDMTSASGLAVLDEICRGRLPESTVPLQPFHARDQAELVSALAREELPEGVSRLFVEKADIPLERAWGGGITAPRYVPFVKMAALANEYSSLEGSFAVANAAGSRLTEHREKRVDKERLRSGTVSKTAYAAIDYLVLAHDPGTRLFDGLKLGIRLILDHVTPEKRNRALESFKQIASRRVGEFPAQPKQKYVDYEVEAARKISAQDLEVLTERSTEARGDVAEVAAKTGSDPGRIEKLARVLTEDEGAPASHVASAKAEKLQSCMVEDAEGMLGTVHRLLDGDDERLEVQTRRPKVSEVRRKTEELKVTYPEPIDPDRDPPKDIRTRLAKVAEIKERVEPELRDIEADPLAAFSGDASDDGRKVVEAGATLDELRSTRLLEKKEKDTLVRRLGKKATETLLVKGEPERPAPLDDE